jgi:transcriptional regulator with XRE-family HTH domain
MDRVVELCLNELEDALRGAQSLTPKLEEERKRFCALKIKAIRKALEISTADLAEAIGVSRATVYRWIGGENAPRLKNIVAIGQFAAGKPAVPDFSTKGGGHRIDIGIFVHPSTTSTINAIDLLNAIEELVANHPGGANITNAELH